MQPFLRLLLVILLAAVSAGADVIVLKSGRRISATNVVEDGDRVYYETAAGRLSFRKDLVERVERGGGLSLATPTEAPVDLPLPRATNLGAGYDEIRQATVGGGAVDRVYIERLETEARADERRVRRVLMAYRAAADFSYERNDLEEAIRFLRRGLTFAPEQLDFLLIISTLHLRRSEFTPAQEYMERALRFAPDNADVAMLLGWAYRGQNKVDLAAREWRRAYELRPDPAVKRALEKLERESAAENEYREGESSHFQLRYHGDATPDLARQVLHALEDHYNALEQALRISPREPIGVILYTREAFRDVTDAPNWAGAINDGRIRIPVQGLSGVTPSLSRLLMHEVAHSFVRVKTRDRAPVWLQEGIAQWMEGENSGVAAATLVAVYDRGGRIPLGDFEGSILNRPQAVVDVAYAFSLAVVEYIVRTNSMRDIEQILDRISSGDSPEAAVRAVLRMDYSRLEEETITFLRRNYR